MFIIQIDWFLLSAKCFELFFCLKVVHEFSHVSIVENANCTWYSKQLNCFIKITIEIQSKCEILDNSSDFMLCQSSQSLSFLPNWRNHRCFDEHFCTVEVCLFGTVFTFHVSFFTTWPDVDLFEHGLKQENFMQENKRSQKDIPRKVKFSLI